MYCISIRCYNKANIYCDDCYPRTAIASDLIKLIDKYREPGIFINNNKTIRWFNLLRWEFWCQLPSIDETKDYLGKNIQFIRQQKWGVSKWFIKNPYKTNEWLDFNMYTQCKYDYCEFYFEFHYYKINKAKMLCIWNGTKWENVQMITLDVFDNQKRAMCSSEKIY